MTLMVKDNFSPSSQEIRDRVVTEGFREEVGPDGFDYTGINTSPAEPLVEGVKKIMKDVDVKMSFFRLNLAGEMPHSYVHSDEICADWASLLYLNTPEQTHGGTAFWKHKYMGWDRVLTPKEVEAAGLTQQEFGEGLNEDWKDEKLWEMAGFVGMKFNRFLIYPTTVFHSRYPHEGFGRDKEDGRLVWVCFFNGKTNDSG